MANQEQLAILKQGVDIWNQWRNEESKVAIDLSNANLQQFNLRKANFSGAYLYEADFSRADLYGANLYAADLSRANLAVALLSSTNLQRASLRDADLKLAFLPEANLTRAILRGTEFSDVKFDNTIFGSNDLSVIKGIEKAIHVGPSIIGTETFYKSKGKLPEIFLQGCGLSDWEIESAKLYNPELNNEEINKILYKMYDLRATQALQISPLFISYSHSDNIFVDKFESYLNKKGIRFWRDIHDMKSGRMEMQIDLAIRQNPTVLLILSEHSLKSDWVEHEVRTARELQKEMGRDVLCPIAVDDSWKDSPWPKRVMEQVKEYNILDFSAWEDDSKFENMFRKLIDGLELFYRG